MLALTFWRNWKPADKYIYLFSLAFLSFTLLWYIVAYFIGNEAVIQWEIVKDSQPIKVVVGNFQKFLLNFSLEADSYAITQTFQATDMQVNTTANYLLLFSVVVGLVLVLTVATYLTNTWFFALLVPIVLYFVSLQLELLGVANFDHRIPLLALFLAYMPLAYYFQSFGTNTKLSLRLGAFFGITLLVAVAIAYFAKPENPALFLANTGIAVPIGLSVLFLAINAHEVIRGLLWLVIRAGGGTSGNTHIHFVVLSLIYLLNLLYAYFHYVQGFDLGIFFLQPLAVLPASVVLGVWGFGRREAQYGNLLDFAPHGALLYNGLAIITLATAAYSFSSGSDSLKSAFQDVVLFTHIGFGASFMLYTLSNFYPLLRQGKDVHKVLYKPYRLDYLWVLIAGTLISAGAFFNTNYYAYYKIQAAYHNGLGDAYQVHGNLKLSEYEYQHAIEYDFGNHKSNYALASLARQQNDKRATLYHYEKCLASATSPFCFANLSEMYQADNQLIDAILKLREGIQKFPNSGELHNNLALLFAKTDIADSTLLYFDRAKNLLPNAAIPETNLLAWLGKNNSPISPDSIRTFINTENSVATASNELVFYNRKEKQYDKKLQANYLKDSILQPDEMCYLYNYTLNQANTADTSMLPFIQKFNSKEANAAHTSFLNLAAAFKHRAIGNGEAAFRLFEKCYDESADTEYQKPKLLGMYLFENEQFLQAAYYFSKSYFRGYLWGRVYQAFAMSELEDRKMALDIWAELATNQDFEVQMVAKNILKLLHPDSLKTINLATLNDKQRYYFVHYNQNLITDSRFNEVFGVIQDVDVRFLLATERMKFFLKLNQPAAAESLRNSFTGLGTNKPEMLEQLRLLDLELLWKLKRFEEMKKLATEAKFKGVQIGYKSFYLALAADAAGDTLRAEKLFKLAIKQIPLEVEVPIAFAQHYNKRKKTQEAYNLLVDNMELYPDKQYFPIQLYEMYILQALELNFVEYGEAALPKLFAISPKARYDAFYKVYETRKKELAKLTEGWE
jgi:hypothetical protein